MATIYAKRIHAGKMTLADVPQRWREATIEKYRELYGTEPEEREERNHEAE